MRQRREDLGMKGSLQTCTEGKGVPGRGQSKIKGLGEGTAGEPYRPGVSGGALPPRGP